MIESPLLHTTRLTLRLLAEGDRPEYIRVHEASRALHTPFSPAPEGTIADRFGRELDRSQVEWRDGIGARFVAMLPDGRHAAYVTLSQVFQRFFQNGIMGWRANAEVAGKGYCTEAVMAVLGFAFAAPPKGFGLHRVQAGVIPRNAASLRVAEKCGFRREGLALKYLQIAGVWEDHILLAKLAEEHHKSSS